MYADRVNVLKNAYSVNSNVIDAGISKHKLVVGNVYLVNFSNIQGHQIAFEVIHEGVHRWESKILVGASSKYIVLKFGGKKKKFLLLPTFKLCLNPALYMHLLHVLLHISIHFTI